MPRLATFASCAIIAVAAARARAGEPPSIGSAGASVGLVGSSTPAAPPAPAADPAPVASSFLPALGASFLAGLTTPAVTEWGDEAAAARADAAQTGRHREPAPFDSPPYPSAEWIMNGTLTIGDPNAGAPYPTFLMDALYATSAGATLRESRFMMYGWIDVGANVSRSRFSNAPVGYIIRPNQIELDQFAFYFERRPDETSDHVDWGFRLANLYGLDYRFTTMKGVFSEQLLQQDKHGSPSGEIYGYDPVLVYVDLWIPQVFEGMNVRVGRFISVPDIEAQLAPDNLMYTHSILYTFDIFTQVGVVATTRLSENFAVQLGLCGGNDIAPWEHRPVVVTGAGPIVVGTATAGNLRVTDHGAQPTAIAMLQVIFPGGHDALYFGVNGVNDGRFGYNNIQECPIGVWQHKFNEYVWTITEAYYMFEKDVPGRGYTWETGVVNYAVFRLGAATFLTVRNEYYLDHNGQRTGFSTAYSEHTVGITHWFNKLLTFRPELRYDHSYQQAAYDGGKRHDQYMLAADLIFHF